MARTKRGWSYPLEAVPAKFRSRRPKDAIRMTATGNTDAKVSLIVLSCVFVLFSLCLCLVAPLLRCLAQTLPRAGAPDDRPRSDVARARQRCRHRWVEFFVLFVLIVVHYLTSHSVCCSVRFSHLQVVPRADCVWRAECKGIAAGCSDGNGDSRSGSSGRRRRAGRS